MPPLPGTEYEPAWCAENAAAHAAPLFGAIAWSHRYKATYTTEGDTPTEVLLRTRMRDNTWPAITRIKHKISIANGSCTPTPQIGAYLITPFYKNLDLNNGYAAILF